MRLDAAAALAILTVPALAGCALLGGASFQTFAVGECLDAPELGKEGELLVGELPVVDCGQGHWAEVFYVEEASGDEFSPSLAQHATEVCDREFEPYVGAHFSQTLYDPSPMYPTEASWEVGDRQIVCLLVHDGGKPITGSAKGTGAA